MIVIIALMLLLGVLLMAVRSIISALPGRYFYRHPALSYLAYFARETGINLLITSVVCLVIFAWRELV